MTNNELDKLARLQAEYLVERLMNDKELLNKVYPSKNLDIKEAANYLRIPVGTMKHIVKDIPHSVIGRRLVFKERDLAEYVQRKKVR